MSASAVRARCERAAVEADIVSRPLRAGVSVVVGNLYLLDRPCEVSHLHICSTECFRPRKAEVELR
jgi:hypothetical protein